jgi:D-tyrosyl-tRNA(Tyr) deacylase
MVEAIEMINKMSPKKINYIIIDAKNSIQDIKKEINNFINIKH